MAAPRLLVTGFGPFPTMPRNPSEGVARRIAALPRWRIQGIDCRCVVLPTRYSALADVFAPALAGGVDAVLMIGVAGRSRRVRVESRASDRRSTLFPDADGLTPGRPSGRSQASFRRARFAPTVALSILRRRGIAAHVSRDAGRYLCNAGYYRALELCCPVLFIHIPKPRRSRRTARRMAGRLGWSDRLAVGFADIASRMITRHAREIVAGAARA